MAGRVGRPLDGAPDPQAPGIEGSPPRPVLHSVRGVNQMAEFTKTVTVNCPYCDSAAIVKYGRNSTGHQRYRCKPCGKSFLDTGAVHGRKASSEMIGTAVRMYYGGMSYKQIAETLAATYDVPEPSKSLFTIFLGLAP